MSDSNFGSGGSDGPAHGYDLLFRGELLPDAVLATVQASLAVALKLDDARLQQLFSGANVMVRRGADRETAARFQSVFRQAGARLRVTPVVAAEPVPAAAPRKLSLAERLAAQASAAAPAEVLAPPTAAIEFTSAPTAPTAAATRAPTGAAGPAATGPVLLRDVPAALRGTADVRVPDLQLAPVGADLIDEDEREIAPSALIETGHLGLAALGGLIPNLVDASQSPPAVRVPDLDIAPVGVVLGELTEFVELPLDLSAYSLAPVGARLGQVQTQAAVALDLSHLALEAVPR